MKLTDSRIKALIANNAPFEHSDGNGLYLRSRGGASASWRFRYKINNIAKVLALGTYPDMSLAQARREARVMRGRVAGGYDVADEKRQRKLQILRDKQALRLAAIAEEFLQSRACSRKDYNTVVTMFKRDIFPVVGQLKPEEVTASHIQAILKAINDRRAPTVANDALGWIKRLFAYAVKRHGLQSNPAGCFDIADAGGAERSRSRALSRDELRQLLQSLHREGLLYELAFKLLLALCCRKMELCAARWSEFDIKEGVWHLPQERVKTGSATDVPLSPPVLKWLTQLHQYTGQSQWLFPSQYELSSTHMGASTLNAVLARLQARCMKGATPFTVHDLRRTAATHMASAGVLPDVIEMCLNHTPRGTAAVYNRYKYFDERKRALELWSSILTSAEKSGGDNRLID